MSNPKLPAEALNCIGRINDVRCSRPDAHDGPCSFADPEVAQLRRDRDELWDELEAVHNATCDVDPASACKVCRLLARVKGR